MDKDKRLSGVKLSKISVPTFVTKALNWKSFWEHFDATIHCMTGISYTEKLMYLQEALKDGPARFVIQGLTRTSESYEKAFKCLMERYDRPRLVQEVSWMRSPYRTAATKRSTVSMMLQYSTTVNAKIFVVKIFRWLIFRGD